MRGTLCIYMPDPMPGLLHYVVMGHGKTHLTICTKYQQKVIAILKQKEINKRCQAYILAGKTEFYGAAQTKSTYRLKTKLFIFIGT